MATTSVEARQLTCEEAFAELDRIVDALDGASVEQTKDYLRHGRAIERTLRAYLDETERELKDIEAGENLPRYEITAISTGQAQAAANHPPEEDFVGADDEIPF